MSAQDVAAISKIDREQAMSEIENNLRMAYEYANKIEDEATRNQTQNGINHAWQLVQAQANQMVDLEGELRTASAMVQASRELAHKMKSQRDTIAHDLEIFIDDLKHGNRKHPVVGDILDSLQDDAEEQLWLSMPLKINQSLPGWNYDEAEALYTAITTEIFNLDIHEREPQFGCNRKQLRQFRADLHQMVKKLIAGEYEEYSLGDTDAN